MNLRLRSVVLLADADEGYERLRRVALAPECGSGAVPGLAVLLRKGLAAWLEVLLPESAAEVSGPAAALSVADLTPRDLGPQLASVLAGMILAPQREFRK